MDKRWFAVLVTAGLAIGLAWLFLGGASTERRQVREERTQRRQQHLARRTPPPAPRLDTEVRAAAPDAPTVSSAEVDRYAAMEVWVQAIGAHGFDALDPWQPHDVAVEVLCAGAERSPDVSAWAESFVWDREARSVWAVAQRAGGERRVEIVRLLAENAGLQECALVDELQARLDAGRQDPIVVPTHGSASALKRQDLNALQKLRRGERISAAP